jgi:tRNA-guanine family transglycosylase
MAPLTLAFATRLGLLHHSVDLPNGTRWISLALGDVCDLSSGVSAFRASGAGSLRDYLGYRGAAATRPKILLSAAGSDWAVSRATDTRLMVQTTSGTKKLSAVEYMTIVSSLGPDLATFMADVPSREGGAQLSASRLRKSFDRTQAWTKQCIATAADLGCKVPMMACVVVGWSADQVAQACQVEGLAGVEIAGLWSGEDENESAALLDAALASLPGALRPRLIRCETASQLALARARDVDIILTNYPTTVSSTGAALLDVATGAKLSLRDRRLAGVMAPIIEGCECQACKTYSRAYLHHLLNANEILGGTLLSQHNHHQLLKGLQVQQNE